MKIELKLNTENANDEINEFNYFICEQNLKGMRFKVLQKEPEPETMSLGDILPIIEIVLGSSVVAASVKGLFDVIKNYFDMRKEKISKINELEKAKIEQHKIEFSIETNAGKKVNLKFSSFNENERTEFFMKVDKAFNS